MRKVVIVLLTMVSVALAWAAIRPSEISGVIDAPKPYGTASLTWLFFTAYDASLWTDAPAWSMGAPFALAVTYKMSFTREELVERTLEEMKRVAPRLSNADLTRFGAALEKAYPNVKSGDRITALHMPGRPVRFFHNGSMTSQVVDSDFAEPFFGVWLSPQTSEPSVRASLLNIRS